MTELLHEQGYQPYRADTTVALGNCPFRGLAQDAPELVCAIINHAYLGGVVEGLGGGRVPAVLACRRSGRGASAGGAGLPTAPRLLRADRRPLG